MIFLLKDFWSIIKKSPFLFLFIFIQIVITSLVLYSSVANYYWVKEQSGKAQIVWGDKEYFKLMNKEGITSETRETLMFSQIKNRNGIVEQKYIDLLNQVEMFYVEAKKIDGLEIIINQHNWYLVLDNPPKWQDEDKKTGGHNIFVQGNSKDFNKVNAYYIDSRYLDYFKINLSEGSYFSKEDYLYESDYIPILMGSTYKKYFSLGDIILGKDNMLNDCNFKVVGFIAENQYYSPVNTHTQIYSYDNIILIPYLERSFEDYSNEFPSQMFLFTSRIYSFLIAEPDKYEDVVAKLNLLLEETGLNDFVEIRKLRIEKELASNYKDQLAISIVVCITTLLFSLFSFVFTMLYKIDCNMKNYAIRMVVGETRNGIAMRYLFESFVVFLLGQFTGFFFFKIYAVNSYIYQGYDYLEAPTLRTAILLNIAFYIVTAIILYVCINVKLRSYSIATLIRGTNIKRENRLPFYRVVIFCMIAIVGVFSMFIASYQVALERIDLYYTGYYSKNVKIASVSKLPIEDAPNVKILVDEIGKEAHDAIINRYISVGYRGDDYIEERGIYFNGYIDPVNMLQGRFFTYEEVSGSSELEIAVVGKEIFNKYVTFNENNEPIYHSPDLEKDLWVIGVMGKEDQVTNLDLTVLMPIRLGALKFGSQGSYTLDGKDEATVAKLEEVFTRHVSQTAMVNTREYTPRITVEAPTDLLFMLLIMIIINAVVFCFYYVSKQVNIHYVKKLVGYSMKIILIDTFLDFSTLTLGAFVTGNMIVLLLKETICKDIQLFDIYIIDPVVVVISLISVLLLTVLLSVIAIVKTFASTNNNNKYRN